MKKYLSSYWIRSAFFTILQRFSLTLFGLVNYIILIRTGLEKEQMGIWALFLAITGIFEATKTNLLKNAHIKYAGATADRNDKAAIASSSLVINVVITIVFIILLLLFADLLSLWLNAGRELGSMLLWFIPGFIFMIFFAHFEAVQQSNLDFRGGFAGHLVRQLLFFAAIVIHEILGIRLDLDQLALYQSASIFFGTIVLYYFTRRHLQYRFLPGRAWIKKILGYGGYIFGSGTVANIYQVLDQFMIANYARFSAAPGAAVASYNAATRINTLVDIPSYAAAEVLFPKASQASVEEGPARIKYLYERMVAILLSFTTPLAIFIIIFPRFVINLIAGAEYEDAAPILQLYMLTGILRPAQNQAANLLNSIGRQKLCFYINTIYLVINLIANYYCLKAFGFYGAAIGTLITFSIGVVIWYFVMKKEIGLELGRVAGHVADVYKTSYGFVVNLLQKKTAHS